MRLNIPHRLIVGAGRLQGRVNTPMREVEEKRPVAIGLNDLDRLIGPVVGEVTTWFCLLYTSPSPRDRTRSRMPSSA